MDEVTQGVIVRDYLPTDEQAWLRCRVLSFLSTAYYDDVFISKPHVEHGAELVAHVDGTIVGILDMSVDSDLATIDTVAVHPDHQRRGVGTALLKEATVRASRLGAQELDAWTRDDANTLAWYRAKGFAEQDHYLHVYADFYRQAEEPRQAVTAVPGLTPIRVFLHGHLADQEALQTSFCRIHVCRRFVQRIDAQ